MKVASTRYCATAAAERCLRLSPAIQKMLYIQVVQPDVVLVTYDALTSDMSQLAPIEWEAIAVDERNRVQPSLAKAHQALRELDANFRLLLPSGNPAKVCCHRQLVKCLIFF